MSLFRPLVGAAVVAVLAGVSAQAGSFFRLEIGPPIAAGFEKSKDLKKSDGKKFKNFVLAVRPRLCDSLASVTIPKCAAKDTVPG